MFKLLIIAAICVSAFAQYQTVEDAEGQVYYLVPIQQHSRIRRASQTTGGVGSNGAFVRRDQAIFNNVKHKVDAAVWASRNYHPKGPLTTGNQVDYLHKPSRSGFSVLTENTRGQGTNAQARGTYNFFQTRDKQGTAGISGTYNQHFGGPQGTRQAGTGVLVHGKYNF